MREAPVQQRVLLALSRGLTRLFRVNTGMAYAGRGEIHRGAQPKTVTLYPGDAVVRRAQHIRMGLTNGGSDTIGWSSVDITPEWVGRRVAVFTAIEVKGDGGRVSEDQERFIQNVRLAGGIAGVAYSAEEAQEIVDSYRSSAGC